MKINDKCKYIVKDTEYDCVILDKKEEFGPSIKNHLLQTMDLTKNIYFKINFIFWTAPQLSKQLYLYLCQAQKLYNHLSLQNFQTKQQHLLV